MLINIPETLDHASAPSQRSAWHHRIVLDPSGHPEPTIEVWSTHGVGLPMQIWHGCVVSLGDIPDGAADTGELPGLLERFEDQITDLCALHRVEWDGNNDRGHWTDLERAHDILDDLRWRIEEVTSRLECLEDEED